MGRGTTMSGRVRKDLSEILTKTNPNGNVPENRKKIRRQSKKTLVSPVQKLVDTCKKVFGNCKFGTIPSPQNIQMLRAVLDEIKPEDVYVSPKMPYFRSNPNRTSPFVTYLHIYKCHRFSMGIFCLPPSGVIPLHNHPEMTVFSKLLFGTMHIKSFDWVSGSPEPSLDNTRLAKLQVDSDFTAPCDTSILYPADGGNMHCFTAKTACAVLDVLGPPYSDPAYSDPAGRHCTYYFDYPFSVDHGVTVAEGYALLKEREEEPEELTVMAMMYSGPVIKD